MFTFPEPCSRPEPATDREAWEQEQRDLWAAHDFTDLFQCTEGITLHGM